MRNDTKECALCGDQTDLCESHIIPKFVYRWQKETSPTGYLRMGDSLNRRSQDGYKVRLLCQPCEVSLSVLEGKFNSVIFEKSTKKLSLSFKYGPWLSAFCASIAWRSVVYLEQSDYFRDLSVEVKSKIAAAKTSWARTIRQEKKTNAQFPVQFYDIWSMQNAPAQPVPGNWNRFLNRHSAITAYAGRDDGSLISFTKMGPVAVFGFIIPPTKKWIGTRVNNFGGAYRTSGVLLPQDITQTIINEAFFHEKLIESVSENQLDVISNSILANPNRFTRSGAFDDFVSDFARSGSRAFVTKGSIQS